MSTAQIALAIAAALVVGMAKTSVAGFGALATAVFALVLPAKESTAAVLLLLIVGDAMAVYHYRRSCDWSLLRRLLPAVLPGIALGALFMSRIDDNAVMRRSLGAILLLMFVLQVVGRVRQPVSGGAAPGDRHTSSGAALGAGVAAGFTTMVANAAGPVMTWYFLAERVDKLRFIGTNAWFFALVNMSKVPFSAALGLFPASTLRLTLMLTPVVLVGTRFGLRIAGRLNQRQFDGAAIGASLVGAALLLRG